MDDKEIRKEIDKLEAEIKKLRSEMNDMLKQMAEADDGR